MSDTSAGSSRARAFFDPRPAQWSTVVLLAIVLAYANGFVLTVLTSAVGSIQRTQSPFASWLIDSTILLPLFFLGVLLALRLARRRVGLRLRGARQVVVASLLVAVTGTVVGIAATAVNGAYDYYLQANELQATGPVHADHLGAGGAAGQRPGHSHDACDLTCEQQQATLVADLKAIGFGGPLMLVADVVLVGWLVALLGGQLGSARQAAGSARSATAAASTPAPAPVGPATPETN